MQLSITVKNAQLVAKGLANIRAEIPRISELTVKKSADATVRIMRVYPAPPSGSRYTRTFRLRNSFRIDRVPNGYVIKADPVAKGKHYGPYVIGNAYGTGQATIHAGRWKLIRDVADQETKKLPPLVESHIRMVARRYGL